MRPIHSAQERMAQARYRKPFAEIGGREQWQLIQGYGWKSMLVGMPSGPHSGSEACPMRHYYADLYPAKGPVKTSEGRISTGVTTYYTFSLFDRRASPDEPWALCESPAGTGYNAAWFDDPQPRFGDAMTGRGNCAAQICVNDGVSPHAWGLGQ